VLLLWQLGTGLPWPAAAAPATQHLVPGQLAHDCSGHHHDADEGTVPNTADESPAPKSPHAKHPCCGGPGCKCQGPPAGLALVYALPQTVPPHPPAPSPELDAGHLTCSPSDPFRPPIV